jgi:hypothetical protein
MTPKILNHVAVKIAPYKAKMYRAMLVCGVALSSIFLIGYIFNAQNNYISIAVWSSAITLGWLALLTSVIQWHHNQPKMPRQGFLKSLNYTWLKFITWFHCIIISISALLLSYVTFASLFRILLGYGS